MSRCSISPVAKPGTALAVAKKPGLPAVVPPQEKPDLRDEPAVTAGADNRLTYNLGNGCSWKMGHRRYYRE